MGFWILVGVMLLVALACNDGVRSHLNRLRFERGWMSPDERWVYAAEYGFKQIVEQFGPQIRISTIKHERLVSFRGCAVTPYETCVFFNDYAIEIWGYATKEKAVRGHINIVKSLLHLTKERHRLPMQREVEALLLMEGFDPLRPIRLVG